MTMRQTAFRLTEYDFKVLDFIKKQMGFASRATALRYALRYHARKEGFKPTKPKKKR